MRTINAHSSILRQRGSRTYALVSDDFTHSEANSIRATSYLSGGAVILVVALHASSAGGQAPGKSDGEMTWLQFGSSVAATPNSLITFQDGGYGVQVGNGRNTAIGEADVCKGKVEVTATLVSGDYQCKGVTAYDAATGKMGKVAITVRFTAKS